MIGVLMCIIYGLLLGFHSKWDLVPTLIAAIIGSIIISAMCQRLRLP